MGPTPVAAKAPSPRPASAAAPSPHVQGAGKHLGCPIGRLVRLVAPAIRTARSCRQRWLRRSGHGTPQAVAAPNGTAAPHALFLAGLSKLPCTWLDAKPAASGTTINLSGGAVDPAALNDQALAVAQKAGDSPPSIDSTAVVQIPSSRCDLVGAMREFDAGDVAAGADADAVDTPDRLGERPARLLAGRARASRCLDRGTRSRQELRAARDRALGGDHPGRLEPRTVRVDGADSSGILPGSRRRSPPGRHVLPVRRNRRARPDRRKTD